MGKNLSVKMRKIARPILETVVIGVAIGIIVKATMHFFNISVVIG